MKGRYLGIKCWTNKTFQNYRQKKKKKVLFIIGDWNATVGSQETPGVTGKFDLGIRNEAGQRLTEFCQENALVIGKTYPIQIECSQRPGEIPWNLD